jgi:Tol biopolymer transport system component
MRSAVLSARLSLAVGCAVTAMSLAACERVSVNSSEEPANADSFVGGISRDGRYVTFTSQATNLAPGDGRDDDVFLRDRATGTTTLLTAAADGANFSSGGQITPNGRYVAFVSLSPTFVPGDTNESTDLFVLDRRTGAITRDNVSSSEQQANADVEGGSISRDGRFVAFTSRATNLVPGDDNGFPDVFVRDRVAGTTTRIPASVTGEAPTQPDNSFFFGLTSAAISLDGGTVAFSSLRYVNQGSGPIARDLTDIYVHDLAGGTTTRVTGGATRGRSEYGGSLSGNGNRIAFASWADDLVPGDDNGHEDVFVRNLSTGRVTRLPAEATGQSGVFAIRYPSLSRSGRRVAFSTNDPELPGGNFYVHDFDTGLTRLIAPEAGGILSPDGSVAAFVSHRQVFVTPVPD